MRRVIGAALLAAVLALAGVTFAVAEKPGAAGAPHDRAETTYDFVLLHEGDYVQVLFRRDAGPGSLRFLSLSDSSRLDILHPVVGVEEYVFRKEHGWQTYPHDVGWQIITVILRETGDNVDAGGLPGCSDVVVRIENAAILSGHHTDTGGPRVRCEVCGATLDWT